MDERSNFLRFYANLPMNIRHEVVLDLQKRGGPITWEVAYREINANTELGRDILSKLIELNFLPNE